MARKNKNKDYAGDGEEFISLNLSSGAKRSIAAIFLFLLALIFALGFFNLAGIAGEKLTHLVGYIFGWGKYLSPIVFVMAGIVLLRKNSTILYVTKIIGVVVTFFSILALLHLLPFEHENFVEVAKEGKGGGYIGYLIAHIAVITVDKIVGTFLLLATTLIGIIITYNLSFSDIQKKIPREQSNKFLGLFKQRKKKVKKVAEKEEENNEEYEYEEEIDEEDETEYFDEETEVKEKKVISKLKKKEKKTENIPQDEFGGDEDFDDTDFGNNKIVEKENFTDEPEVVEIEKDVIYEEDNLKEVENFKKEPVFNESQAKINRRSKKWKFPPINLLEKSQGKAKGGDVNNNANVIKETLSNFGINVELHDIVTGPTVTRYSFRPPSGVKLTKITSLNADLALALAAHPIRIEAPIPGKSLVGIEVPNKSTVAVRMQELVKSQQFKNQGDTLPLALGKDVNGEFIIADLAKMPHLLVAGATGAGKSVTINSILISLLYKNSPEDLKMILVDPKRVELSLYNGIPHLLADVIVDNDKVLNALKWAISEMERRYKLLQETGSRDINSYNVKRKDGEMRTFSDSETGKQMTEEMENLPMIVIVMDELADLMASHGKEVEGAIVRLAQMSRAIGIHLIVSTQRPSVEVITGLIKANLPTRIALRVATGIDSRTIIDSLGAEKLVGYGDMLFVAPNSVSAQRLQGVFIEEHEVKKVVDFIKNQNFDTDENELEFENSDGVKVTNPAGISSVNFDNVNNKSSGGSDAENDEPLYEEAKELVIKAKKASTSYIQRRLRVGYARAARIIDILEENGVVGPPDGSKPRKILVGDNSSKDGMNYENPEDDQMKRDKWQA
ncbi:MAG: DNA translocase FtsK 4TM domain-containing protein [Candidatus Moranbacteria bacterium]|nr:DNA translocase FtsK 4TM domain-containing protein [Candidatus Moranbacteria bacterium]